MFLLRLFLRELSDCKYLSETFSKLNSVNRLVKHEEFGTNSSKLEDLGRPAL